MSLINECFTLLTVVLILDVSEIDAQHGQRGGQMTPKFMNTILKLHNEYRRSEGGSNMKQLRWSPKLQRDAQIWANKCRYAHAYGKWGENLFKVESHLPDDVLIERAVNEWYFEKMSWKFTPDCSEACHYTQVVWATSEEIGCAFKRCPTLFLREEFIPNGWMLVCYYSPQGNIIGQMPYTHGKPCSACQRGDTCDRGLCSKPTFPPQPYRAAPNPVRNPPRRRPTPRTYRAPPHPPQRQPPPQPRPNYPPQTPPRQPPANSVRQPPPPQPQLPHTQPRYQQPAPQMHPVRHQPQSNVVPPKPNVQPASARHQHETRVWRGHEQIYQTPPKQTIIQQPSQVQYISGKVLTGWIPAETTKSPVLMHVNQTSYQQQFSAQAAQSQPISHQQAVPAHSGPARQQPGQQGLAYQPGQHAVAAYNPQSQYQQQYPIQQPATNIQPSSTSVQQYPVQSQQSMHTQYQQPAQAIPHQSQAASPNPAQNQMAQQQPAIQQQYTPNQGQVPNHQYYQQQPSPQHSASVFVDPRPIYVPPAPPKSTTPTPPPPPPPCQDLDKNCKHWGVYCKSNPYVHDNCRTTCNTCTIPTPPAVPDKTVQTSAAPQTTVQPSIVPSRPPSPVPQQYQPQPRNHRPPQQPQTTQNNYVTTTAAFYPQTTGYNNVNQQNAPTTNNYPMGPPGGGPAFGPCRNFDNRCKQWAKYCGIDEYVDDTCRLTCMRCNKM